jgi:hypothetical protein
LLAATLFITGCAAEEPAGPPLDMRHTTRDLMAGMIDASADALWDAVGTIWDENGENHWEPETDEEWLAVTGAAMTLIESGNLLMLGNRARDTDQWMAYSQEMIDAGAVALEAAQARDPELIFDSGEVVYNACNNCHSIYWVGDEQRGRTVR